MVSFFYTGNRYICPYGCNFFFTGAVKELLKHIDPGESIRPADPVVFDRIRIGFHRNQTFFIKNRSDPTKTLSDPIEIISIRRDPITPQSHGEQFHDKDYKQLLEERRYYVNILHQAVMDLSNKVKIALKFWYYCRLTTPRHPHL